MKPGRCKYLIFHNIERAEKTAAQGSISIEKPL